MGIWDSTWSGATPAPWPELAGKTLCILGYGHIGRALAQRARAFGMDVRAMRRDRSAGADASVDVLGGPEDLRDLLRQADYVVVTLSLNDSTRGLIGKAELDLMKPSAFLVNVARAEIIDEAALYRALADRRIAGAALDVWYRYPAGPGATFPGNCPFHELPNVLMTPHVSGWTAGMLAARVTLIVDNIERIARGEPPANVITSPSS
jgi:phosphoglycerate dehydrogenase-like enzyme